MATRPDLSQLFQVDPYGASTMLGQQSNLYSNYSNAETGNLQEQIQNMQQEREQKAQMHPLMLQYKSLQNQGLQAGLPGITADVQAKLLRNKETEGTMDSTIAATNAGNSGKVDMEKYAKTTRAAQAFMQLAPLINGLPEAAQRSTATDFFKNKGLDEDSPVFKLISNIPPGQFQSKTQEIGQQLAQQSQEYITKIAEANVRGQWGLKEAQAHAGGAVAAARVHAESMERIAESNNETKQQVAQMKMGLQNEARQIMQEPDSPEKDAKLRQIAQMATYFNNNYGAGIDLQALQTGHLSRNADRSGSITPPAGQPAAGTVKVYQGKRYQFTGGNYRDQNNWKEIQ